MINDFGAYKNKCLGVPFVEFAEMMDDLFGWHIDYEGDSSMHTLWDFSAAHFRFRHVSKRLFTDTGLTQVTFEDIANVYMTPNIIDIISDYNDNWNNRDVAKVYIIYD